MKHPPDRCPRLNRWVSCLLLGVRAAAPSGSVGALGQEHNGPCPPSACRSPCSGATSSQAHGIATSPSPSSAGPSRRPAKVKSCWPRAGPGSGASSCPQHAKTPPGKHPAAGGCEHVDKPTRGGMRPPKSVAYIIPQPVGVRGM